jgi:DNA-directed RNA polymerase subunit RPC12/RpoP
MEKTIVCGNCGEKIVIDSATPDGSRIRCPFCGEKTILSRPKRVELPMGVVSRAKTKPAPVAAPAMPSAAERESAMRAQRVAAVEGRIRAAEDREASATSRSRQAFVTKVLVWILLAGIAVIGWLIWSLRQS